MTNPIPHDPVTRPAHYTAGAVECIDAIRAALGVEGFVAYCRGAAIKYAWRSGLKANHAEDLRKGAWYLTKAAELLEQRVERAIYLEQQYQAWLKDQGIVEHNPRKGAE